MAYIAVTGASMADTFTKTMQSQMPVWVFVVYTLFWGIFAGLYTGYTIRRMHRRYANRLAGIEKLTAQARAGFQESRRLLVEAETNLRGSREFLHMDGAKEIH